MKKRKATNSVKSTKRNIYPLPDLTKRWEREELTVEQAVGQILLWLAELSEQIQQLDGGRAGKKAEAN